MKIIEVRDDREKLEFERKQMRKQIKKRKKTLKE